MKRILTPSVPYISQGLAGLFVSLYVVAPRSGTATVFQCCEIFWTFFLKAYALPPSLMLLQKKIHSPREDSQYFMPS
jgi:hypothetical protein